MTHNVSISKYVEEFISTPRKQDHGNECTLMKKPHNDPYDENTTYISTSKDNEPLYNYAPLEDYTRKYVYKRRKLLLTYI